MVSLFKNKRYSPFADFAPKLHPPAYPLFVSEVMISTVGYFFLTTSILSSVDPLSTTNISIFLYVHFLNESRHSVRILVPLKWGIMMESLILNFFT
jgi:hypothetical protein